MIVHVASFLESIGGSIDKDHYLRPIPGRTGYAAYCRKPEYTKKKQKEMAEREMVKKLSAVSKKASVILRDPVQRVCKERNGKTNIVQHYARQVSISVCLMQRANPLYQQDYVTM